MKTTSEHIALPTLEEIRLYAEGGLDPERTAEIRILAEENEFVADALEGYAAMPVYSSVPSAEKIFHSAGGTPWWHLIGWGAGVAIGASLALFLISGPDELVQIANNSLMPTEHSSSTEAGINADQNEVDRIIEKETFTGEDKIKNVSGGVKRRESDSGNKENRSDVIPSVIVMPDSLISYIPTHGININDLQNRFFSGDLPPVKRGVGEEILHIRNYHIVDYTQTRKREWPMVEDDVYGVPARFENRDARGQDLAEDVASLIPYITYIEQSIDAFAAGYFKAAAEKFGVVLENYPDDINALFYGAMSYYYNGEYQRAIDQFNKASGSAFHTFDEEIAFYRAKSLKELGLLEEATECFRRISSAGGYYALRAEVEMTD